MERKEYKKSKSYDRQEYFRERYLRLNPDKSRFKIKSDEERKKNKLKSQRICKWKIRGVVSENFEILYKIYLSTKFCDNCGIQLNINNKTKKCLDHDHDTGLFRNILCHSCNIKRR